MNLEMQLLWNRALLLTLNGVQRAKYRKSRAALCDQKLGYDLKKNNYDLVNH